MIRWADDQIGIEPEALRVDEVDPMLLQVRQAFVRIEFEDRDGIPFVLRLWLLPAFRSLIV